MRQVLMLVALSCSLACGQSSGHASLDHCSGVMTDNINGTTTVACTDGTKELVCTNSSCAGVTCMGIAGTDLTRVALRGLEHVDCLSIVNNPKLTTISLPALTGNWLVVWGNPALTAVDLPALTTLVSRSGSPSRTTFAGNNALTTLALPSLTSADLDVLGSATLLSVSLPALRQAGTMVIQENYGLKNLSMPALTSIQNLTIAGNSVLSTVSVSALRTISGDLRITANAAYPQCQAEAIVAQLVGYSGIPTILYNDTAATCP